MSIIFAIRQCVTSDVHVILTLNFDYWNKIQVKITSINQTATVPIPDIQSIVDGESQADPSLKSTRMYIKIREANFFS